MKSTNNFQDPSVYNHSSKAQSISDTSKLSKLSNHTSGLSMLGGLSLLTLGTILSNVLIADGMEGIVSSIFVVGFSLIYYGVSEDNE